MGTLPIDNNPAENTILPIAIGKKNWMFVGSARVGRRAAAIQSLLDTVKFDDVYPLRWLARSTREAIATSAPPPSGTLNSQSSFKKFQIL